MAGPAACPMPTVPASAARAEESVVVSSSKAVGSSIARDSSGTADILTSFDDSARRYEPTSSHSVVSTQRVGSSTARPMCPVHHPGRAASVASAARACVRNPPASASGTRYRVTASMVVLGMREHDGVPQYVVPPPEE